MQTLKKKKRKGKKNIKKDLILVCRMTVPVRKTNAPDIHERPLLRGVDSLRGVVSLGGRNLDTGTPLVRTIATNLQWQNQVVRGIGGADPRATPVNQVTEFLCVIFLF